MAIVLVFQSKAAFQVEVVSRINLETSIYRNGIEDGIWIKVESPKFDLHSFLVIQNNYNMDHLIQNYYLSLLSSFQLFYYVINYHLAFLHITKKLIGCIQSPFSIFH